MGAEPQIGDSRHDDYDLLPYPSLPYAHTQPARVAAVAALHGLETPDVRRARVLEVGCASGGNIIPLAARTPEASFLGLDLSRGHVEQAQQRIARLGLSNIEIRQEDVTHVQLSEDRFDYVICHGVFSWAPPAAQDAILRICRDNLTPNGVACISYNVLPGWHLRNVIRDICLRHADSALSPQVRVAKARTILDDIAGAASESSPYGLLLRKEAQRIRHRPASYILGEFLVAHNTPAYFSEFVSRAAHHRLEYMGEADFEAAVPEVLSPDTQSRIAAIAGSDPIAREQYIDYISGRTLRNSLLVHADAQIERGRDFSKLRKLHLSGDLEEIGPTDPGAFKDSKGRKIRSVHPAVQIALGRIAAAYPETRTLEQLAVDNVQSEQEITAALSTLVTTGQVEVSTLPLHISPADADHPQCWSIAIDEAAENQPWLTNIAHHPVLLKPAMQVLIPHLNGVNDRTQLRSAMSEALQNRDLIAPEMAEGEEASDKVAQIAALYVERALNYMARSALLTPAR